MLTVQTFPVNPLSENTYIVSDETQEAVIIDCGAFYDQELEAIDKYISSKQLKPVAHILTHAHFDHIFSAAFIYDRYGLKARCHQADLPLFEHAEEQMRDILGHALRHYTNSPAGEPLTDDSVITFGTHQFTLIPTPGHTPGGVCFYCAEEHILFSGDSLFQMSIGRTDFPGGDHWSLIRSLHKLLRELPDDVIVYPGHGMPTTTADEKLHNPYLCDLEPDS